MANEPASKETSPTASLFQKAHSRMVMLQRLDEQVAALLDQRSKAQEELKALQHQVNEEFNRIMKMAEAGPIKMFEDSKRRITEAA